MDNIIMLFACLSIGMGLRQFNRVPDQAHVSINAFIINVSLPAVTLLQIHAVHLNRSLLYAALMPWLLFAASALLFWYLGRALKLSRPTTGALAVLGGLGNTSFIGLPMIESFYGVAGIPVGIIIDQLGSYLALSTIGILVICSYSDSSVSNREIVKRIATFPPLLGLLIALALIPVSYPGWIIGVLSRLAGTLAPLALVSIGLQLRFGGLAGKRAPLVMGLGCKLVVGPLLILIIYAGVMGLHGRTTQVTLFEAAMAPQIGGAIVATQYGLDAQLISLMVGIGTILSFLTLPLWWRVFSLI